MTGEDRPSPDVDNLKVAGDGETDTGRDELPATFSGIKCSPPSSYKDFGPAGMLVVVFVFGDVVAEEEGPADCVEDILETAVAVDCETDTGRDSIKFSSPALYKDLAPLLTVRGKHKSRANLITFNI